MLRFTNQQAQCINPTNQLTNWASVCNWWIEQQFYFYFIQVLTDFEYVWCSSLLIKKTRNENIYDVKLKIKVNYSYEMRCLFSLQKQPFLIPGLLLSSWPSFGFFSLSWSKSPKFYLLVCQCKNWKLLLYYYAEQFGSWFS